VNWVKRWVQHGVGFTAGYLILGSSLCFDGLKWNTKSMFIPLHPGYQFVECTEHQMMVFNEE
jgi:hypothetical protein